MNIRLAALVLPFCFLVSCGRTDTAPEPFEYTPVVLIVFTDVEPVPELPMDIPGECLSRAVLVPATDGSEIDMPAALLNSAIDDNLLLCLVNCAELSDSLHRDNIMITSGVLTTVSSSPPEVLDGLNIDTWNQPTARNIIVRDIMDKYRPDLLISIENGLSAEQINELASVWFDSELTNLLSVVFYSPPVKNISRGWAVLGGPSINGTAPVGLSAGNLLATIRLLSGIPWNDSIPDMIPAVRILNVSDNIFEDDHFD